MPLMQGCDRVIRRELSRAGLAELLDRHRAYRCHLPDVAQCLASAIGDKLSCKRGTKLEFATALATSS